MHLVLPLKLGVTGRCVEFGGVAFVRHTPHDQYELGRGHNFKSQMGYGPRYFFCGAHTPPARRE
jgi:hypothetical protein